MIKMLKKIKSPAIKKHQGSSLIIFLRKKFTFALSSSKRVSRSYYQDRWFVK